METSKLIETLRFCGDKESCCTNCPSGDRVTEYTATECLCDLMQKAANAIEELRLQLESHRDSENAIRLEEKQATSEESKRFAKDTNVLTNADRIRSMTDDELVSFLMRDDICDAMTSPTCMKNGCESCVTNWLQQPVKEDAPCSPT